LPAVVLARQERAMENGHDAPKQTIMIISNGLTRILLRIQVAHHKEWQAGDKEERQKERLAAR